MSAATAAGWGGTASTCTRAWLVALALWAVACRQHPSPAAPAAPGSVAGRVLSQDGPGDAEVQIKLTRASGAVSAETTTRPGGGFRFSNVAPGSYQLTADAAGWGAAAFPLFVQPGEELRTVVHLKEPARLEGVVVDRRSRPVPDALVLVWRSGGIVQQEREVKTDEQGRFAIARLATAAVTVFVQAPGIGSVKLDGVGLPSRPLRVVLEGEGRSIYGSLANVREPLSNFSVRLGGPGLRHMRSTAVDPQGRFVFHGLGAGDYSVRAGGVSQASPAQAVVIEQADAANVVLPLEAGEVISGRVSDGQGQALPGTTVVVQAVPPDGCAESVTTDVVGYFSTVALRRGRYEVVARAQGYVGPDPRNVAINARPASLSVRLQRAGRILGRVLQPDGRPAGAAEVTLLSPAVPRFPHDRVPVVPGHLPLAAEAAALGTQVLPHVMGVRGATSDATGAFTLSELGPGSYGLRVSHPGASALEVPARTLVEGGQLDFGVLKLQAPVATGATSPNASPTITPALPPGDRVVNGQVRDPRGRGLSDVAVTVRPTDPEAVPVSSATSSASGAFTLSRLPAVPLVVRAQHKEYGVISRELAVGERSLQLKFPNPGGIEGEVVDGNGRFLSGARVTLMGPEGLAGPPVQMAGAGFRVLGVPPGPWTVKAVVPGYAPVEAKVEVTPAESPHVATVKGVRLQARPQ